MTEIKKVVLAYSGGLDTSIIIPWLKENYNNPEIIAVAADVGQGDELDGIEEKALETGAAKIRVEDLADLMVDEVIIPSMMMGAKYEDYLLGTAFARPVIARRLVEIAREEGADAICHGCTGKGNDQVRFELAIRRFAPDMKIIAPWREWTIRSREEEIDYAEAHSVPLKISRETSYSKDKNLWHLSHEGLDLEDPANEPKYDEPGFLEMGVSPFQAPDAPTVVTIDFEKGWPVAVDGERMKASDLIRKLNELGGQNGIGLLDIVENRVVEALRTNETIETYVSKNKIAWSTDEPVMLRNLLKAITGSEIYADYMALPEATLHDDSELWRNLFKKVILDNTDFLETLEEKSVFWNDDLETIATFVLKSFRRVEEGDNTGAVLEKFKDDEIAEDEAAEAAEKADAAE